MDKVAYENSCRRLENWGRWAREGGGEPHGRCGSIEGRYLREKADDERLKREATMPIDTEDAQVVEKAVLSLKGKRMRVLLVGRFVYQRRKEELCRKLKLDWALFEASVRRSVFEVHHQLERHSWWQRLKSKAKPEPRPDSGISLAAVLLDGDPA